MRTIYMFGLCLITLSLHAQKFKMGKISIEELTQQSHPLDTSAAGAVLYTKGSTTFKFNAKGNYFSAVHEMVVRYKIYKKEGLYLANMEIPYYVGYKELRPEWLKIEEAATYNLVNGKVVKTKVNGSGTFKERVNEYWKTTTVVFPEAKVGSVLEIRYTLSSENIHVFPSFKFQREIPVDFAEYATQIPVNYQYKIITKGLFPIKSEGVQKSQSQSYENEYNQSERLSYEVLAYTHTAEKVPALKAEAFVDNPENYRAAIEHELEIIRFPNVPDKNLALTWESLAATIFKDEDFGAQLKEYDYYKDDLKRVVEGVESKQQRMTKVFEFVQRRMAWNEKSGYFTRDGVKKAWQNGTGNIAEINLMLISMLNMAGVETYPVLLSTIDNGVASFPNQSAFNYVIAAAIIDGKKVLLDASNKNTVAGILPLKTLNWNGRMIRQNGLSEEIAMTPANESRLIYSVLASISANGAIKGKVRVNRDDYAALEFRERYQGMNKTAYAEQLESRWDHISIENYSVENENKAGEPIVEQFDFESSKHAEAIGDKLYVDPILFLTLRTNPFRSEERALPIFFGYPSQERYMISFTLPEGYEVESLPQPILLTTGGKVAEFKLAAQGDKNHITVSASSQHGVMLVKSSFYPNIKEFYSQMVNRETEKIVLKKI